MRTPAFMVCVSLVPPGTLKPPPAHTPISQGWPWSGLDCAPANSEVAMKAKSKNPPRRHGDTENSEEQRAPKFKFIHSPGNKEGIRSAQKTKSPNSAFGRTIFKQY